MKTVSNYKTWSTRAKNATTALLFLVAYTISMIAPFVPVQQAHALDTGWKTPTATHAPNDWDVNTVANVQTDDNVYASENDGGQQGYGSFGFGVPAGAVVNGIEVRARAFSTDNNSCRLVIRLSWNGGSSTTSSQSNTLTNNEQELIYGGATDTWGHAWTASELNDASFVNIIEDNDPGSNCTNDATTSVDTLSAKVYYTVPVTPAANPALSQACGLDIALVIDNSTSIDSSEMSQMKTALTSFTNALSSTPTEFSVTRFADSASVTQAFTNNVATVNTAINAVPVGGGYTNWEDGFTKAASTLPNRSNPNLVIFATDGDPTTSNTVGGTDLNQPNAHLSPAMVAANAIKTGGTRILMLGIGLGGDSNSVNRLKQVSGPNADTGSVLTSDVITTNFSTLATALATFAQQTCGGTITTQKLIDADGNLQTTNDQTPAAGWTFDVNGGSNPDATSTDANGLTPAVKVNAGSGYSVNETVQAGYSVIGASCQGKGTWSGGNAVTGIQVGSQDIIRCTFINTLKHGTLKVHKVTQPANDGTVFSVTASGSGQITGSATRSISTAADVTYDVTYGTYNVAESPLNGWSVNPGYSNCSNVVVNDSYPNQTCTITNTKLASLTIIKDAIPNDAQDFAFTTTNLGGNFSLDDDSDNTLSNTKTINNLAIGQAYTVSEAEQSGWKLTDLVCSGGAVANLQTRSISFTPSAGQNASCTYTNAKLATINGLKWNDQDGDGLWDIGEPTLDGWTINLTGTTTGGQAVNLTYVTGSSNAGSGAFSFGYLLPGTYTVTETPQSNWVQTSTNPVPLTVIAGQTVNNVNFGNRGQGKLTVIKQFAPSNDSGKVNLLVDGVTKVANVGHNGTTGTVTVWAGTHSVSETAGTATNLADYTAAYSCSNNQYGSGSSISAIVVNVGDNITCTFTNTRKTGTIKVVKKVINDNGGKKTAAKDFSFKNNGGSEQKFAATYGDNGEKVLTLNIGSTFNIKEIQENKDGYATTYSGCSGTVSDSGQTCTITNNDKPGTITVIKNVDDGYGHVTKNVTNWTWNYAGPIYKNGIATGSTNPQQVKAGIYTVSENQKSGYHVVSSKCTEDSHHSPYGYDNWNYGGNDYDMPSTSQKVSVGLGEKITCEFTNRRDTGTITVHKKIGEKVDPSGWTWWLDHSWKTNDMGDSQKVTSGWYRFGENQQTGYSFDSLKCKVDGHYIWVDQAVTSKVYVGKDDHVECTFTNSRDTGNVTIVKDAKPDSSQGFVFTIEPVATSIDNDGEYSSRSILPTTLVENQSTNPVKSFTLIDNGDGKNSQQTALPSGKYRVSETPVGGWDLSSISCGNTKVEIDNGVLYLDVVKGAKIVCTFTNTKRAQLTVIKDVQPGTSSKTFSFTTNAVTGELGADTTFSLSDDGTGLTNSKQFENLLPGTYTVTEQSDSAWKLNDIVCSGTGVTMTRDGAKLMVTLAAGAVASCTFVNSFIPQVLAETFTLPTLENTGTGVIVTSFIAMLTVATALWVTLYRRKNNLEVIKITRR